MATLLMREAVAADLQAIVAMLDDDEQSRGREDPSLPLAAGYLAAFAAIERDQDQLLVVAEQAGAIVGTLQLSFLPGLSFRGAWRGQIEAVRIARDRRGHGLGAQLIEWAIARCRERDCRMVQLTSKTTRARAHRFYARLGFVQSHVGMKLLLSDHER